MEHLGHHYSLIWQKSVQVGNVAVIDKATSNDLSFCSSDEKQGLEALLNSKPGISSQKGIHQLPRSSI
jgi:hypothetical protein